MGHWESCKSLIMKKNGTHMWIEHVKNVWKHNAFVPYIFFTFVGIRTFSAFASARFWVSGLFPHVFCIFMVSGGFVHLCRMCSTCFSSCLWFPDVWCIFSAFSALLDTFPKTRYLTIPHVFRICIAYFVVCSFVSAYSERIFCSFTHFEDMLTKLDFFIAQTP
jgi:hypothetical protein